MQEKQNVKLINILIMKQFLVFIRKEWSHIWRDPKTLFILFGMPIVQITIFGFALTNEVKNAKIAIVDPSKDVSTAALINRIEASRYFEVKDYVTSYSDIETKFKEGKIKIAIVFPQKFNQTIAHTNTAQIQIIADASDPNTATVLTNYASVIIQDWQKELNKNKKYPYTITSEVRMLYNPELKGAFNFVPGVMAMVLMLVSTLMTSIAIVREKELGMMEVLLVSPLKPIIIILAKTIPYLVLSLVNILSILLLSVFALELPIAGSLPLLIGLSLLFTITSLSLGLLISSVTNSQQVAMLISLMGLFLPTLMLSGFMFPIENMPLPLRFLSNFVPAKWYYFIVKAVMIKGLGLKAIWKETSVLIGMTIFLIVVSIRKYNVRLS